MYDLASFKYIFVECFINVLVLLLLEFLSFTHFRYNMMLMNETIQFFPRLPFSYTLYF